MIFAEVRLGFKTEFFVLKQDRVCSIIQEMIIDKKTLEHLAALSRIDIDPKKEEKLLGNLEKILAYFEELKAVDTDGIEPAAGGTTLTNVFREDKDSLRLPNEKALEQFPEKKNGFLKIPQVFNE